MSIIRLVAILFSLYRGLLFARILFSWIQVSYANPIVQWIYRLTEPVLAPFRRALPPIGGFDFSPIIVFLLLQVVEGWFIRLLLQLGLR